MNDLAWMNKAYQQALLASARGEVPVGAVLVDANQNLLAAAGNQVIADLDATAHAELLVLRAAGQQIGNYRLENCTLYVTLEPCPMCAAAIVHARIRRLVFATRDFNTGACGSVLQLLKGQPFNHRVQIDEGIMQEECSHLLREFFVASR